MKKFFNALLLLICCFLFVGCLDDSNSTKKLTTKQSSYDIWQYYYDLENSNKSMLEIMTKNKDESLFEILENDANTHFLSNALRDSIATIDMFDKGESIALFQYDQLKNYKVNELISGKKYNVSYIDCFSRNLIYNSDSDVDKLIFEVGLKMDNEITIEKSDGGVYSVRIIQKAGLVDDIQAETKNYSENNNKVCLSRQVSQTEVGSGVNSYVKTIVTATKTIEDPQGNVSTYKREEEFYKQGGVSYLKDSVTYGDVTKVQTFRLDNTFSSIFIKYVPETGYFSYEMSYNLNGRLKLYGEVYFQGFGSFIEKVFLEIIQGEPFGIKNSFVLQKNIIQNDFFIKASFKNAKNFDLKEQNMETFAVYNGEENCVCAKNKNQEFKVVEYK